MEPINWIVVLSSVGTFFVVVGFFVRHERRMTRIETLVSIIVKKLGLCLPSSDKSSG